MSILNAKFFVIVILEVLCYVHMTGSVPLRSRCFDQPPRRVTCPYYQLGGLVARPVRETRYYYNTTRGCLSFNYVYLDRTAYSCMTSSYNMFESENVCRSACMLSFNAGDIFTLGSSGAVDDSKPAERCSQDLAVGMCRAMYEVFGFDKNLKKCVVFYYSGCLGNSNRFNTIAECQQVCEGGTTVARPSYLSSNAICNGATYTKIFKNKYCSTHTVSMYQYNPYTGRCEQFIYTGCGLNLVSNQFDSEGDCRRNCLTMQRDELGVDLTNALSTQSAVVTTTMPRSTACPPGSDVVNCFLDPCRAYSCPQYPNARCQSNNCGGCNARFFVNNTEVDCNLPVAIQVPPPPTQ